MSRQILIIDDSLTVRMDLGEAFQESGFEVTLCSSADAGRRHIATALPDVIILDVVLPDADGVEFLIELRNQARTEQVPVILLSGESEVQHRLRGLAGGASEYVGKPYDKGYIVARAEELLRREHAELDARPKVLVIDDSVTFREELGQRLQGAGYSPLLAASGPEGLKKAAAQRPDALVVDGVMPEMDGVAVIRRIRLDPGLSATPCLLLTGSEGSEGEVSALDSGADDFLRKEEGLDVVLARLSAILRGANESVRRGYAESLLSPKRVLAVDDSSTYLETIAEELRNEGYEVVQARSGEQALDLLAAQSVDCILLDLMMPGLSGTETCRRIKSSSPLRNTPLIMLTSLEDREAMIEGINAGADDYVAKSASFDVVKARLRAQLRRKHFEDENRGIRDELLRKSAEVEAATRAADERKRLLAEVSEKNEQLAVHVAELQRLNAELEMFAYSVSHDLRQPLRGMDGFSKVLLERYAESLDDEGQHYLRRIGQAATRMAELIDGLLVLSRVSRVQLRNDHVQLDEIAQRVLVRLKAAEPTRQVETHVASVPSIRADGRLFESVLENLLGNAWKFTSKVDAARIEFGVEEQGAEPATFFVRDNGAGFDMNYATRLFGPFQRLHSATEFSGTGIGLATVQRVLHRHGGRVWAESKVARGATFYFSLQGDSQ